MLDSGGRVVSFRYFLALDGLKGDLFDAKHVGWFEVSGFDIDLENLGSASIGSGSGTGKAVFSPLTLTLDDNTGLASFLALAATGEHLVGATLIGVTDGAKSQDKVYQLDLADVLVTKVVEDEGPGLTLSLDYSKIELETFGRDDKGAFGPAGQFGYDLAANKDGVSVGSVVPSGSVAPSPQPTTYFMLIDGLDGGATDKSHAGWFEITGFDLDLANIGSTSTGSGAGAGKADFSRLEVKLSHEAGLAEVMDLAATGKHVKGLRIEGMTAGAKSSTAVYDLTLANVLVTKVADAEGDGYSLSLDYSKIALVTQGIDGAGKISQNGAFGYDLAAAKAIAPFSLALSPSGNVVPVADALSISTDEDTAAALTLSAFDADGDSLSFAVVSGPSHGTLLGTGASLTYVPDANYNGPDSFTYVANDGAVDSAAALVSVTVTAMNDAPTDADETAAGIAKDDGLAVAADAANGVLANAADIDRSPGPDTLVVDAASTGLHHLAHGDLTLNADGSYSYVATDDSMGVGFTGTETFTYTVIDGHGGSDSSTLTINIAGANDAPSAVNDTSSTDEDHAVQVSVLNNDTDPDSMDSLSITGAAISNGALGTVTVSADHKTINYDPGSAYNSLGANEHASVQVGYSISDGHGGTSSATATIDVVGVNDAPIANADIVGVTKKASVSVSAAAGVLSNDIDPDLHDALSVSAVNGSALSVGHGVNGTYGSLTLNANGSYTYVATASSLPSDKVAQDTFTYTANDGHGGTSSATLIVTVVNSGSSYAAGSDRNDVMNGGNGSDVLDGGRGNDMLAGGNGADVLIGGAGDDVLTGNNGPDTFVFAPGFGHDRITDFDVKNDALQISRALFANVTDLLQNHTIDSALGAVITDAAGTHYTHRGHEGAVAREPS